MEYVKLELEAFVVSQCLLPFQNKILPVKGLRDAVKKIL